MNDKYEVFFNEHDFYFDNPLFKNLHDRNAFAAYVPSVQPSYTKFIAAEKEKLKSRQAKPLYLERTSTDFTDDCSGGFYYPLVLFSLGPYLNLSKKKFESGEIGSERVGCPIISDKRDPVGDPTIARFPMCDAFRIADSGGLQLARGVWKFDVATANDIQKEALFEMVLRNQEQFADMAVVLDFPTEGVLIGTIGSAAECADFQVESMSYFAKHRDTSSQTLFLNVLQGDTNKDRENHYQATKNFDFTCGVCISFRAYGEDFSWVLYWLWRMLKDRYLSPGGRFHVHFLGVGHLRAAVAFTRIQQAIRRHWDFPEFTITFDSSTPFMLAGRYNKAVGDAIITSKEMKLPLYGPISELSDAAKEMAFPSRCGPIQTQTTVSDYFGNSPPNGGVRPFDAVGYQLLMAGNVYATIKAIHSVNHKANLAILHPDVIADIPPQIFELDSAVNRVFCAPNEDVFHSILGDNLEALSFFGGKLFKPREADSDEEFDPSYMDLEE